jgi:hypothetical protein
MSQLVQNLRSLTNCATWSYQADGPSAAEPAALACLALACHDQHTAARLPARWLVDIQATDGSVGVNATQQTPAWPTALAILAWNHLAVTSRRDEYAEPISNAVRWSLQSHGTTAAQQAHVGHDTMLNGWSWAANTHAWLEPTCMFVLALRAAGQTRHQRTREAVRLIVDRLLPAGGCNYGNTIVLGQALLPHVQPTGLAMLALGGEDASDQRIERSLAYLQQQLNEETSTSSLCYGLMGLAAHGRQPAQATAWLEKAARRLEQQGANSYKRALIALAACPHQDWLRLAESPLQELVS